MKRIIAINMVFILWLVFSMNCSSEKRFDDSKAMAEAVKIAGTRYILLESMNNPIQSQKMTLTGNYHDLGYFWGLMAKRAKIPLKRKNSGNKAVNIQLQQFYEANYPEHLEKVKGVAKAYKTNASEIDLTYMERDFFVNSGWVIFNYGQVKQGNFSLYDKGCSMVAYQAGNEMLVGRNFDYPYNWPRFVIVNKIFGVNHSIGNTIICPGHWIMDGINEKGLTIGVMVVGYPHEQAAMGYNKYPKNPQKPAINAHHMMQIVLDKCATVEEAITLIGKMRLWFSDEFLHFLIADSSGRAAVLEFDINGTLIVKEIQQKFLLSTNNYLSLNDQIPYDCERYQIGDSVLKATEIHSTTELCDKVMIPMSVPKVYRKYSATLWISLFNLSQRTMDVRFMEENYSVSHVYRND